MALPVKNEIEGHIELLEASIARSELFANLLAERYQIQKGNVYMTLARLKDVASLQRQEVAGP